MYVLYSLLSIYHIIILSCTSLRERRGLQNIRVHPVCGVTEMFRKGHVEQKSRTEPLQNAH